MCGIAGIINFDGQKVDPHVLKEMTDTLYHRGPDDEGYFINNTTISPNVPKWKYTSGPGNVGLGHRRLSIIDLSSGHQPMSVDGGQIWIVFNGEIYNFPELRDQLQQLGHTFTTSSDTETILHAYRQWGEQCVDKFRGMFAFVIWDETKKEAFIARDRLGKKPLYYYHDSSRFVFGSELKAILAYPGITRAIDPRALADYFALLYIPAPKSIFKNIAKLPAGHTMVIRAGGSPRIRQYWDLRFEPETSFSEGEWCEQIVEKFRESVKLRTISEVPLGAFLSGGIDSSAVVAMLAGMSGNPVKTSSVGFSNDRFNELPYAREVVKRYGTDHHEMIVEADAVDVLDRLVWHYDEPFADSSAVPTYYVSKLTREKVTVALSGDGGDENFAGYRRYYFDLLENRMRGIFPQVIRATLIAGLAKAYPKADWLPQMFRAKTLLSNLVMSPMDGYYNSMSWFGNNKTQLLSEELRHDLRDYDPKALFERYGDLSGSNDPLSRIQYVDIKTYLVEDILTKVDRASMANSLEVRVPLLDHEFMELVAKIPSSFKLRKKEGKYIFKKALKPYVAHETLYRKKMGFSIPLSEWLKNDLRDVFEESVFRGNGAVENYLNLHYVRSLWKEHQRGTKENATELWAVLFFAKWANIYL